MLTLYPLLEVGAGVGWVLLLDFFTLEAYLPPLPACFLSASAVDFDILRSSSGFLEKLGTCTRRPQPTTRSLATGAADRTGELVNRLASDVLLVQGSVTTSAAQVRNRCFQVSTSFMWGRIARAISRPHYVPHATQHTPPQVVHNIELRVSCVRNVPKTLVEKFPPGATDWFRSPWFWDIHSHLAASDVFVHSRTKRKHPRRARRTCTSMGRTS